MTSELAVSPYDIVKSIVPTSIRTSGLEKLALKKLYMLKVSLWVSDLSAQLL